MYDIIEQERNGLDIVSACSVIGVSRSGYKDWLVADRHPDQFVIKIRNEIHAIATEFTRYGYRRMTIELQRRGFAINHKAVLKLMREDNLLCVKRLFKPITTSSNLAKDMAVTDLNQLWVAGITYIRLENEFVYLAVIIDVFSRKCIG